MIDKPKPPLDEEEGEEKKEGTPNEFQYNRKPPRNLLVMLAVIGILFLLALAGIIKAVSTTTEDPSKITFPEHMSKSLAEEQPAEESATHPPLSSGETVSPETEEPVAPAEETQTESTLDLNEAVEAPSQTDEAAPVETAPQKEEKVNEKKPLTGPQTMIIWDHLPTTAPQKTEKTATLTGARPRIVIVIDDMGLNHRNSQAVVGLAGALTLAYLPYAEHLPQQTQAARARGHELIVHMPMEPDNIRQNNPGPDALLTTNSTEENLRRLDKNLSRFTGYVGLNNHMGSHMTANAALIRPILAAVKQRGLWFLDSKTIGNSVAGKIAGDLGIPYVERDVFLDNVASVSAVMQQLHQTEAVARRKGYAVAIGHPHDATIAALREWLPQAQAQGFELVPLSAVIAQRFPQAPMPVYAQAVKRKTAPPEVEPAAGKAAMTVPPFGVHAVAAH